jgi:hypothetical protein
MIQEHCPRWQKFSPLSCFQQDFHIVVVVLFRIRKEGGVEEFKFFCIFSCVLGNGEAAAAFREFASPDINDHASIRSRVGELWRSLVGINQIWQHNM